MDRHDRIAICYTKARELIKQNNPRAARAYVVEILNEALKTWRVADTEVSKVKTEVFMKKWIAVSRDLYNKGVTEYVLSCFGLATKKTEKKQAKKEKQSAPIESVKQDRVAPNKGEISLEGLVDDTFIIQEWSATIFEMYKTATVVINAVHNGEKISGTGFIISKKGYMLTNDHVVFNKDSGTYYPQITMSIASDKEKHKIEVLFSDKKADVALCRFNPEEVPSFTIVKRIKDYSSVKQGAECLIIGNAFNFGLGPTKGNIRFAKDNKGDMVYTALSNPGDSGGPVFNCKGECIGINKSKSTKINGVHADGFANATPMDTIDELLQKWAEVAGIDL